MLACDTGPGSKLLVLLTDGRNYGSWLSARSAIDAARRHEVVIYPVGVDVDEVFGGDGLRLLRLIANATGGRAITADRTTDLTATFRQILEEYRQRYIIAFSPEGVPTGDGWHTLDVRLQRGAKATVHARAGYWAR